MYKNILESFKPISDQIEMDELSVILQMLDKVLLQNIKGNVVEFGCYTGTTSLYLRRLLDAHSSTKRLFVYDSFDGLPEKSKEDQSPLGIDFKRGELRSTKVEFIHNFRKAGLALPIIKKGWFHEIEEDEIPGEICFAFLDGDYYKSIRTSLQLIENRMQSGGVIIIDDVGNEKLPGARRALEDWNKRRFKIIENASLGIVTVD